jgi:choline dehydrogenase
VIRSIPAGSAGSSAVLISAGWGEVSGHGRHTTSSWSVAGSAGCVLAARLSASGRRILLLEAGPDYPRAAGLPADIADGFGPTLSHDWSFASEADGPRGPIALPPGPADRRLLGNQRRLLGARGWPVDYDAWAAAGNTGWSFDELLPVFCAVEADTDFPDDWHGTSWPDPGLPAESGRARGVSAGVPRGRRRRRPPAGRGPQPARRAGRSSLPSNVRNGIWMSTALTTWHPPGPGPTSRSAPTPSSIVSCSTARGSRLRAASDPATPRRARRSHVRARRTP